MLINRMLYIGSIIARRGVSLFLNAKGEHFLPDICFNHLGDKDRGFLFSSKTTNNLWNLGSSFLDRSNLDPTRFVSIKKSL